MADQPVLAPNDRATADIAVALTECHQILASEFYKRLILDAISPESAAICYSYPFGNSRCLIRYWVETAIKGSHATEMRLCSQTTERQWNHKYTEWLTARRLQEDNPGWLPAMRNDIDKELLNSGRWNAPKQGVYSPVVLLYWEQKMPATVYRRQYRTQGYHPYGGLGQILKAKATLGPLMLESGGESSGLTDVAQQQLKLLLHKLSGYDRAYRCNLFYAPEVKALDDQLKLPANQDLAEILLAGSGT